MGQSDISGDTRFHSSIKAGYEGLVKIDDDGASVLNVLVSGVHCAACIQKIETTLARETGMRHVRLNFSTGRLFMEWDGAVERANDFVDSVENLGYRVQPYDVRAAKDEAEVEEKFLLLCLGVAGFAMGNVMLLSVGVWSSSSETMGVATRDLMHWVSALIALPTILFAGRPFYRSAIGVLVKGHTNMDVPISLALLLAGGMSLFETVNHGEHVYFDSAVMLMFFLLIGRYLDFRARKVARSSATNLLSALSGFANVLDDGQVRRVLIRDVQVGMVVRVAAGEAFPVDGVVVRGKSNVDTSLVTGETLPRGVDIGVEVYAGTMNVDAPVDVEVVSAAENSLLSDIVALMEKAGQGQAKYVRLADRAARLYTPVVHVLAIGAFIGWWWFGGKDWQPALLISITVLIITCPCALGLAVPVVQVLASGRLMQNGVLVKSGDALERLGGVDSVMLDKTGTLTRGQFQLVEGNRKDALQVAASLAAHSVHPLSRAVSEAFSGNLVDVQEVEEVAGYGLKAVVDGVEVKLGSRAWCGVEEADALGCTNQVELWLDEGGRKTCFAFQDALRDDVVEVLSRYKAAGLDLLLVSGDRREVAETVATEVGVEHVFAEQTPPEKFKIMEALQEDGHKVLMIGDGLNDAPVLAGADVSMAPGSAIDLSQNAADIVFMGDAFAPTFEAYRTAKLSQRLVKQNIALAILYNFIAVPIALAGFATPMVAAICMSGSSLLVVANSFRLRWMV